MLMNNKFINMHKSTDCANSWSALPLQQDKVAAGVCAC
jgi:hypothetical protein